ncbi:Non-specific lipid transfer protein GPI-anchored 2 [Camellia lanceoleosa]|uniref:Non-specific lipid transfer protein GPI-anchored 2 n=1 Tax=Camellia lanceoleosa TaxID=1840588 RepID=A0ACC0F4G6_9ERIC|nr:Non-specific lipid transfer protein GPI-anchored 2 [Camellia lanceoleosa]
MTTTTIAKTTIIVATATATLLLAMVAAQAPAAAPEPAAGAPGPGGAMDCITSLANMSDCLTYVQAGSNLTKPDKACCPELAGLVESNPICLCQLLGNTSATLGIQIELNKALNLPTVCAVQTPPISTCAAVGYPVPGPMSSEASGAMSPSPAASGNSGNVASPSIAASQLSILVGLAIAFLTTLFF